MKKSCFMMMAMMMRMCGMRIFQMQFFPIAPLSQIKNIAPVWAQPSFVFNRETLSESLPVFVLSTLSAKGTKL